jgi:hypothetical protein
MAERNVFGRLLSFSVRAGSVVLAVLFVAAGVLYVKQESLLVSFSIDVLKSLQRCQALVDHIVLSVVYTVLTLSD